VLAALVAMAALVAQHLLAMVLLHLFWVFQPSEAVVVEPVTILPMVVLVVLVVDRWAVPSLQKAEPRMKVLLVVRLMVIQGVVAAAAERAVLVLLLMEMLMLFRLVLLVTVVRVFHLQ
jgi:hypothetical protein